MPNFAFRYQVVRSSEKIDAKEVGVSIGSEPARTAILMKSRLLPWKTAWFGGQLSELGTVLPIPWHLWFSERSAKSVLQFGGLQALKLRLTAQKRGAILSLLAYLSTYLGSDVNPRHIFVRSFICMLLFSINSIKGKFH